jgi:hypothetical protein
MTQQKLPEQGAIQSVNWETILLSDARENTLFHELINSPVDHARFMSEGLTQLVGLSDPDDIARRLAVINEINVVNPKVIGAKHSSLESNRLQRILAKYSHYQQNSTPIYDLLIDNLGNGGGISKLQNLIGEERTSLGIATPIPTEMLVENIARIIGIDKRFSDLSTTDITTILKSAEQVDFAEICKSMDLGFIFTSTGTGRNIAIRPQFTKAWHGGTYIEVGGSVGIHPLEIKESMGFEKAISVDILTDDETQKIETIADYSTKQSVRLTEELRTRIDSQVKRVYAFDARSKALSDVVSTETNNPRVVGIHNLLVHILDKDKIIRNATQTIGSQHGFLWTSGGYNGNEPVLYNFVLELQNGKVVRVFKDQYNKERTGGVGIDIDSEKQMENVFIEERS